MADRFSLRNFFVELLYNFMAKGGVLIRTKGVQRKCG